MRLGMKLRLRFFLTLLFLLIASSCSEEKLTNHKEQNHSAGLIVYTTNPLDSLGIIHNDILEKFTIYLEEDYLDGDFVDVIFPSNDFNSNVASALNKACDSTPYFSTSSVQLQKDLQDSLNLNNWFSSSNYSTMFSDVEDVLKNHVTTKDSLYTINLMNDIKDIILQGTTNDVFDELETAINLHESLILAQSWDSSEVFALGAIAVAKHSTQFWKDFFTAPYGKKVKYNNLLYSNGEKALIVGANAAGAIVGSIKGAIVGSALSPSADTIGGYFAGKVAGAFIGSGAAMTYIGVKNFWVDLFN